MDRTYQPTRPGGPLASPFVPPSPIAGGPLFNPILMARPRDMPGGGPSDPRACRAEGEGLSSVLARHAASFTITSYDASGRRRRQGGEPFMVTIRGCAGPRRHGRTHRAAPPARPAAVTGTGAPNAAPPCVCPGSPGAVSTSVRDAQDGTYHVSWVANVSGVYWIAISLHGEHIAASPFSAQVPTIR